MSSITVRNLDESVKTGLRLRAARHGWSMEQEVRQILREAVDSGGGVQADPAMGFGTRVNLRFKGLGLNDLPIPARQPARELPQF